MNYSRLGVKTRIFHLGDYRRATVGPGQDIPEDYFFVNGEAHEIERPDHHDASRIIHTTSERI
jgi:hypothetical protein